MKQKHGRLIRFLCSLGILRGYTLATDSSPAGVVSTAVFDRSYKGKINGLNLLFLKGSQSERGFAHGYLLAEEIIRLTSYMVDFTGAGPWNQMLVLVKSPAVFKFPTRFEDELEALLKGLQHALPYRDLVISALGREILIEDLKAIHCIADAQCSQFAVWGSLTADGDVLIGRNLDYKPLIPPDLFYVVAVDPDETTIRPTIDVLAAGTIGLGNIAMNADGLYLALHSGGRPGVLKQNAVPAPLILRNLLETTCAGQYAVGGIANGLVDEKATLVRLLLVAMPISAGQSQVLEWDPNCNPPQVAVRGPSEFPIAGKQALVLTNHFIKNRINHTGSSIDRYKILKQAIEKIYANHEIIDFDKALELLKRVDRSDADDTTLIAAIIQPNSRSIHVAIYPGPHDSALKASFTRIAWDEIFNLADRPASGVGVLGGGSPLR